MTQTCDTPLPARSCYLENRRDVTRYVSTTGSIVDRLIGEYADLAVERETASRMKLRHEDHNHVFFRVDSEAGVEKASPIVLADGRQFGERSSHAVDAEADAETEILVGCDLAQLIVRHQFDRLAA